jgi:hypothetical protein
MSTFYSGANLSAETDSSKIVGADIHFWMQRSAVFLVFSAIWI